jgi:hypothetical protein
MADLVVAVPDGHTFILCRSAHHRNLSGLANPKPGPNNRAGTKPYFLRDVAYNRQQWNDFQPVS